MTAPNSDSAGAITVVDDQPPAMQLAEMSPSQIVDHTQKIAQIMKAIMVKDEHYGVIPGTKKPSLYQPGAHKIALAFGLRARYKVTLTDHGDHHREYEVICQLSTSGGMYMGEGVGCCSTLESKYRYRQDVKADLPAEKIAEFWRTRDKGILGGPQFSLQKRWCEDARAKVWKLVERVAHGDTADYWNTCLKMAKKRAFVDAVLMTTAASDIFSQDVEDADAVPQQRPQATDAFVDFMNDEANADIRAALKAAGYDKASARTFVQAHDLDPVKMRANLPEPLKPDDAGDDDPPAQPADPKSDPADAGDAYRTFVSTVGADVALAYLRAAGWLTADQGIDDLSDEHVAQIAADPMAFIDAARRHAAG